MEHQIDRRLKIVRDAEKIKNNKWSIYELDKKGNIVGEGYEPWHWTLSFIVTDIVFYDKIGFSKTSQKEAQSSPDDENIRQRSMLGTLKPGHNISEIGRQREPRYQMFGTNRAVEIFEIKIIRLQSESDNEYCSAFGTVMTNIQDEEEFGIAGNSDCILFHIGMRPSNFDRYAEQIYSPRELEMILQVRGVSGFYSKWSLDVYTDTIKILTASDKEHPIQTPPDFHSPIPRLGSYLWADLTIKKKIVLEGGFDGTKNYKEHFNARSLKYRTEFSEYSKQGVDRGTINSNFNKRSVAIWTIGLLLFLFALTIFKA